MTAQKWEKRVCNLIKNYKPTSNVAAFRNEYGDVVRVAAAEKKIRIEDAELLMRARDFLEEWANSTTPGPPSAFEQWRELYDAGKNTIPGSVWESILKRF